MTGRIKTRTFFFAALSVTALLAALPPKTTVHIPPDLRDAPAGASDQLQKAGRGGDMPEAPAPAYDEPGSRGVIGSDDRVEYFEASPAVKEMADAVVAMVMKKAPEGVQGDPPIPLCPGERFYGQPALAFCTGFLVGEDLVATAGHCIKKDSCSNTKFVFGFAVTELGAVPAGLGPDSETYSCKEVLVSRYTLKSREDDMALVRLDRPVRDRKPLPLNTSGVMAAEGTPVITIGHFLGVPLKISLNGDVRVSTSLPETYRQVWFTTSLDTFPGNSGGPVINAVTGLVEGINVRSGGRTFPHFEVTPAGCRVAKVYPAGEEWGPESNNIARLLPYLGTGNSASRR